MILNLDKISKFRLLIMPNKSEQSKDELRSVASDGDWQEHAPTQSLLLASLPRKSDAAASSSMMAHYFAKHL